MKFKVGDIIMASGKNGMWKTIQRLRLVLDCRTTSYLSAGLTPNPDQPDTINAVYIDMNYDLYTDAFRIDNAEV